MCSQSKVLIGHVYLCLEPRPECVANQDCPNNKACINQACRDPCRESANVCAANAECRVQQHRPYCFCRDGLTGNAHSYCYESECHVTNYDSKPCWVRVDDWFTSTVCVRRRGICPFEDRYTSRNTFTNSITCNFVLCVPVGCRVDTDCLPVQACVNTQCMDPCAYTQCGLNAICRVDNNHKGRCYCPETYFGNPLVSCERPQCISDSDCPLDLACVNQKCQSPCSCAPNAICTVLSHTPNCRCPPGYTGNPYESCQIGECLLSNLASYNLKVCLWLYLLA